MDEAFIANILGEHNYDMSESSASSSSISSTPSSIQSSSSASSVAESESSSDSDNEGLLDLNPSAASRWSRPACLPSLSQAVYLLQSYCTQHKNNWYDVCAVFCILVIFYLEL